MAMFPCASASFDSSPSKREDDVWLRNPSFSAAVLHNKETESKNESSEEAAISMKSKSKSKQKKSKKHKVKKREKERNVIPSLRDADKVFIDDVAGLIPEFAFRIDRSRNASILAFGCLAPAHVARFRTPRAHLRSYESLTCEPSDEQRVKRKRKRYFSSSAVKAKVRRVEGEVESGAADEEEKEDNEKEALNKRVREEPTDVQAWIRLSQLEDNSNSGPDLQRTSAILERAVAANPYDPQLRQHRLEVLQDVWPVEQQLREWRALTFAHPNRPALWRNYLRFLRRQGAGPGSSVSAISATIGQACASMRDILAGKMLSHKALPAAEEGLMDLMFDFCEFLASAGLTERAVGCWQLALEVNLCPELIASDILELFWDSEAPKLGERGAKGCSSWRTGGAEGRGLAEELQERANLEDEKILCSTPSCALWLPIEESRSRLAWLPLRGEADDPERVVLFEDVSKVAVTRFSSDALRRRLVVRCLAAFGLQHSGLTFAADCPSPDPCVPPLGGVGREDFAKEIVEAAREAFPKEVEWLQALDELLFDLELPKCSGSKAIKRFARPLLSRPHNRNFLPLWGRFAAAEWTQGGGASAGRPLFEAALRFSPGQVLAEPVRQLGEVWAQLGMLTTQAELEWALGMTTGDLDPVKKLLVSLLEPCDDSGSRSVGPALLRVSKAAEGLWKRARGCLDGGEAGETGRMLVFRVRSAFADLCVLRLLLLLLVRPEVEEAAQEAHTWLQPLPASLRVTASTRLTAAASAFAASRFLSPAPIQRLAAAIAIGAPDEPGAVQLVLRASGRSGLLAPLRVTFEHVLSGARCAHTWASIIEMEEARLERFPGVEQRIHSLYERALCCQERRTCIELWRRFLCFEASRKKARARSVFYRALQNCPFARRLLLEGARVMHEVTEEVIDVMTEREMRLRTPLEEVEILQSRE